MHERDLEKSESLFSSALEASRAFHAQDARIDVSFGNLVQLASRYDRHRRPEDARRILDQIESVAGQRRIPASEVARYQRRFDDLVRHDPLHPGRTKSEVEANTSTGFDQLIRNAADFFDVDPALVKAVVAAESNFEPRAVSPVGAQGLMQLMPATARAMGVTRPFKPSENIRGGVRYLRTLLDQFDELGHALAAYNAGPHVVERYGGIPPYPETVAYVTRVLSHYRHYQASFQP